MQRITDPTAVSPIPSPPTLTGTAGFFTEGSSGVSAPTDVRGWWLNMIQEELISLLTAADITPDTTGENFTQVLAAIKAICVPFAHMGINGGSNNSGSGSVSTEVSFTPTCNGIVLVNGNSGNNSGTITGATISATGATELFAAANFTGGVENGIAVFSATFSVTAGTPVTITASMTGSSGDSDIGFNYILIPTS